jgi:hypothetical protein
MKKKIVLYFFLLATTLFTVKSFALPEAVAHNCVLGTSQVKCHLTGNVSTGKFSWECNEPCENFCIPF